MRGPIEIPPSGSPLGMPQLLVLGPQVRQHYPPPTQHIKNCTIKQLAHLAEAPGPQDTMR